MLTRLRSLRDRALFLTRSEGLYAGAVLGVLLTLLPLLPLWSRSASLVLAGAGVAATLVMFGYETKALSGRFGRWILSPLDPIFDADPPLYQFSSESTRRGTMYRSAAIDTNLLERAGDIPFRVLADAYVLPRSMRQLAPYVMSQTTSSRWPFNGRSLRLNTDPDALDPLRALTFRPASYFDFLCSNELMKWRLVHRGQEWRMAEEAMLDGNGHLLPLASSPLANVVGISTVALTTDGFALVVQQTASNSASGGLLAPSGSGSLEPRDAAPATNLRELLVAGAEREMIEETGIPRRLIASHEVLGFGRWLERGAKPEFFLSASLRATKAEVSSALGRRRRDEHLYTGGHEWVSIDVLVDAVCGDESASPEARRARGLMSLPLRCCVEAWIAWQDNADRLQDGLDGSMERN